MTADSAASVPVVPSVPTVVGRDLRVAYRGRTVLDVPEIVIPAGKTYVLLGASGAGKSTLLRVLGLLEAPTSGAVTFDGRRVARRDLAARRRISAVFQKPHLLRGTVGDNAGYGLRLRHVPRVQRRRLVADALATVGLAGWEDRSALTLSGGEAQRVALARALVLSPSLLLLDEPLSYLDPLLKRSLTREFAEILASESLTALYVTHDQDEAAVVADIIGVMRDGRIVSEGDPDSVLGLPADDWVAAFVGMEPPLRGVVVDVADGLSTVESGGARIVVACGLPLGASAVVAVRPEDVVLYEPGVELPRGSARNHLPARVVDVRPLGGSIVFVLDSNGARFAATVSRASAAELALVEGSEVTAVFKATAVRARMLAS